MLFLILPFLKCIILLYVEGTDSVSLLASISSKRNVNSGICFISDSWL